MVDTHVVPKSGFKKKRSFLRKSESKGDESTVACPGDFRVEAVSSEGREEVEEVFFEEILIDKPIFFYPGGIFKINRFRLKINLAESIKKFLVFWFGGEKRITRVNI